MNSVASRIHSLSFRTSIDLELLGRRWTPWMISLLALVTRIYGITANGLRTDEIYGLWMANRAVPELLRTMIVEGHGATPPTFNLVMHFIWRVSQELWAVRLLSVLAGVALVWITFYLARKLFDFKTAALSALLVAVSPFNIEYSQVARAYSLSSLLAFLSLTAFALMWISPKSRSARWLYVVATLGALGTHYLTFGIVIFENLVVAVLAAGRRLSKREVFGWVRLQALIFVASLPLIWLALRELPMAGSGSGQTWLARPSLLGIVRTLILWGTGDPSFGGARFTLARGISLAVLVCILVLGSAMAWKRLTAEPDKRDESLRLIFVGSAFLVPWFLVLGISFFRRIFNEKYFLFLIPLLLMMLAWSVLRIRPVLLGRGLLIALLGTTLLAMTVYHSSPSGEQWREALEYVREERHSTDYIAVMPGFYVQPVYYYLTATLPPDDYSLLNAPITLIGPGGGITAQWAPNDADLLETIAQAKRLWLITGYAGVAPGEADWFFTRYAVIDERNYLGVRVMQGQGN